MRSMRLSEGVSGDHFRVRVKVLGPLKEVLGEDIFVIEAYEGESLLDALKKLPKPLQERIFEFEDEGVAPDLLVLVDGVEISCLGSPDKIRLNGVKEIHLVPVIHGG